MTIRAWATPGPDGKCVCCGSDTRGCSQVQPPPGPVSPRGPSLQVLTSTAPLCFQSGARAGRFPLRFLSLSPADAYDLRCHSSSSLHALGLRHRRMEISSSLAFQCSTCHMRRSPHVHTKRHMPAFAHLLTISHIVVSHISLSLSLRLSDTYDSVSMSPEEFCLSPSHTVH